MSQNSTGPRDQAVDHQPEDRRKPIPPSGEGTDTPRGLVVISSEPVPWRLAVPVDDDLPGPLGEREGEHHTPRPDERAVGPTQAEKRSIVLLDSPSARVHAKSNDRSLFKWLAGDLPQRPLKQPLPLGRPPHSDDAKESAS